MKRHQVAFFSNVDHARSGEVRERWNLSIAAWYQSFPRFAPPSEIPSQFGKNIGILHLAHAIYDTTHERSLSAHEYPFLADYRESCGLRDRSFEQITDQVLKNLRAKANLLPAEVKRFLLIGA